VLAAAAICRSVEQRIGRRPAARAADDAATTLRCIERLRNIEEME
jgi:hypothetical protein